MTAQQNAAFSELIEAWEHRFALRQTDAQIRDLAAARFRLDDARVEMAMVNAAA